MCNVDEIIMESTKSSNFSYTVKTQKTINQAVEDITAGLKKVGFGVVSTLNFKEMLQKKRTRFEHRIPTFGSV